jgi:hypothetical protein
MIHVDDGLYASNSQELLTDFESMMQQHYTIKISQHPKSFLNIAIEQHENGDLTLNQNAYVNKIAERFELSNSKETKTPLESKLNMEEGEILKEIKLYQEITGCLNYLNHTRIDTSFATQQLSRFMSKPSATHLKYAKRVISYLLHNSYGLRYKQSKDHLVVTAYVDSDFANCKDRKSITGYIICLNGSPIIWKTVSQKIVALSTAEAEYIGITLVVQEILWLKHIFEFLSLSIESPIMIWNDNQSSIRLSDHHVQHSRTKHIDVRYHFIREHIKRKIIEVAYLPSEDLPADMLTKSLDRIKFQKFRELLLTKFGRVSRGIEAQDQLQH